MNKILTLIIIFSLYIGINTDCGLTVGTCGNCKNGNTCEKCTENNFAISGAVGKITGCGTQQQAIDALSPSVNHCGKTDASYSQPPSKCVQCASDYVVYEIRESAIQTCVSKEEAASSFLTNCEETDATDKNEAFECIKCKPNHFTKYAADIIAECSTKEEIQENVFNGCLSLNSDNYDIYPTLCNKCPDGKVLNHEGNCIDKAETASENKCKADKFAAGTQTTLPICSQCEDNYKLNYLKSKCYESGSSYLNDQNCKDGKSTEGTDTKATSCSECNKPYLVKDGVCSPQTSSYDSNNLKIALLVFFAFISLIVIIKKIKK